jgi:putative ABC transport system permease protein
MAWCSLYTAFLNLIAVKIRSFLAVLGVLVGTGSVIALMTCSQLATSYALQQFKNLGTNVLALQVENSSLQLTDMSKLKNVSSDILDISPYIMRYQPIYFDHLKFDGGIVGVTQSFANIIKIKITKGRFVSFLDGNNFFCIIGAKIAEQIRKKGVDPLFQQIRIENHYFTVIGVAGHWEPNFFLYVDIDNGVLIPIEAARVLGSAAEINNVLFRLPEKTNIIKIQNQLSQTLKNMIPNKKIIFRNPQQIIQIIRSQRKSFTLLLVAISGISLMVGGIGIMNIMLVSVAERRQEIGIRMAIGAKPIHILEMFLIESVLLTGLGGFLGVLVGLGISFVFAVISGWKFHFYFLPVFLGFMISLFIGILSGIYPAFRASKLDPIKALQTG